MWERQYEHGRWNGHKLNILSTAIDGGQRLHISEIPYATLPHIRIMGSKARTFKIEVVFVGADSLSAANAFIANLEDSPEGELEHPWLGELPLVFEAFSQNISTKRGLVTLSLSFVRAGTTPELSAATSVSSAQLAASVDRVSASTFTTEVANMSVTDINQTQNDFTQALDTLTDITHRVNSTMDDVLSAVANNPLKEVYNSINKAYSAVSRLGSMPDYFSDLFGDAVDTVADCVQSEAGSDSEAVDNARNAQQLLLNQMKEEAPSSHYNTQMVMAAVKVSKDLVTLEKEDSFDITATPKQPDIIKSDLSALIDGLDNCIERVTQSSTAESLEVFDSLVALKSNVQTQLDKVNTGTRAHRIVQRPRFIPALTLAYNQYTEVSIVTAMNALQHPLFMRGEIAIRDTQ